METQSWLMLKILINRFNPTAGNVLLKFLPEEDLKKVNTQNIVSSDITPLLKQPQTLLQMLHFSWLQPIIQQFPSELQPIFIGALTEQQSTGLNKALEMTPCAISSPVRMFLQEQLYSKIKSKPGLPIEYLPVSDFSELLNWNKRELVELIDFLGLYDVASKIRNIVNKQHLENIYSCLNKKQHYYLRVCLYQKEKLIAPKLNINPAKKNPEKLKKEMHLRGLIRLGKALCGENMDLVWYIAHILDIGRGQMLLAYYKDQPIPNVSNILKNQVLALMNFLKKSEKKVRKSE